MRTQVKMSSEDVKKLAVEVIKNIGQYRAGQREAEIDRRLKKYNHGIRKLLRLTPPTREEISKEITSGWDPMCFTHWNNGGWHALHTAQALLDAAFRGDVMFVSTEDLSLLDDWILS